MCECPWSFTIKVHVPINHMRRLGTTLVRGSSLFAASARSLVIEVADRRSFRHKLHRVVGHGLRGVERWTRNVPKKKMVWGFSQLRVPGTHEQPDVTVVQRRAWGCVEFSLCRTQEWSVRRNCNLAVHIKGCSNHLKGRTFQT